MVPYNTQVTPLILRENGRNIQQMIDFCVTIEDREERNRCAYSIAAIMANLFPELTGSAEGEKAIWDHMMVISNFRLDVDFPCEVTTREKLNPKPTPLSYPKKRIRYRHYGRLVQKMINEVVEMPDGPEKDELIFMIANHMKKVMLIHSHDEVDDARIFRDLADYTDGRIILDPALHVLHEFKDIAPAESKSKKKKKK